MFIERMLFNGEFDPGRGHTFLSWLDFYKHANPPDLAGAFARLKLFQTFKVLKTLKVFGVRRGVSVINGNRLHDVVFPDLGEVVCL